MTSLSESLQKILSPPPARITGLCAFLPSSGVRINTTSVMSRYKEAIASLSQRLGTDKWFLGSRYESFHLKRQPTEMTSGFSGPTPLDALAFAYLYSILHSSNNIRIEVSRRANLVAWEQSVRNLVSEAFIS